MSDAPDPETDTPVDTDAEQARLDHLRDEAERVRKQAKDDLEPGGSGRTFTDAGVRAQVEKGGDTHHPLGDR